MLTSVQWIVALPILYTMRVLQAMDCKLHWPPFIPLHRSDILSADCNLQDYNVFQCNESLIKPSSFRGYFRYSVPCGGILTSIEARGFCGRADNVQLRLLYGSRKGGGNHFNIQYVNAECNAAKNGSYMIYEGKVLNNSLNILIPPGGFLTIFFNPDCSNEKCYFQPAIISETSNYTAEIADGHLVWSATNLSLLLSAVIKTSRNNDT